MGRARASGPAPVQMHPETRELFADRNFLRLWVGEAISYSGDALWRVAIAVYVYQLTGSPAALGGSFAFLQLPWIFLMPFAGTLGDRVNRKWLLLGGILLQAAAVACLASVASTLWQVYLLVVLSAVAQVVQFPTLIGATLDVVGKRLFTRATAVRKVTVNGTDALGAAFAGALIAAAGVRAAFGLDVLTFVVYALLVGTLRVAWTPEATAGRTVMQEIGRGIAFIWTSPPHRFILAVMVLRGLTMAAVFSILYAFVRADLRAGPFEYGLFAGASALGFTVSAATYTSLERHLNPFQIFMYGNILAGTLVTPFLVVRSIPLLVPLLFLAIYCYGTGNLVANVYMVQLAPQALCARVAGNSWAVIRSAQAIGSVALGIVATVTGTAPVIALAGVTLAVGCMVLMLSGDQSLRSRPEW